MTSNIGPEIKSLKNGVYNWEIKKWNRNRSADQNEYYHGVVVKILSEHTGFETDEMHDILRGMFLNQTKLLSWNAKKKKINVT